MSHNTITVLRARGRRLTKLIRPHGEVEGYDAARTFDMVSVNVTTVNALLKLLTELQGRPDCAVVRGAIVDPHRTRAVRRLAHADPETGDLPTLREEARQWLALDLDGLPLPANLDVRDLAGCGAYALSVLPAAFQVVRTIVAASSSHGFKPGARLRLWTFLDRPLTGREVSRWLRDVPVDHAVFRPAQVIYTAAPVFGAGVKDPLPCRLLLLEGELEEVATPSAEALAPPPFRISRPLPSPSSPGASAYAVAALNGGAARVASASVNSRHFVMVAEARRLARFVNAGLLMKSSVHETLGHAAEACGKTKDEAHKVVEWAMLHPSGASLPEGLR